MTIAATTHTRSEVSLVLPSTPQAAATARRALGDLGLGDDLDGTAALLATELVTNALRHSHRPPEQGIDLLARHRRGGLRVEVRDGGAGFDPRRCLASSTGFGLALLERLSTRWGVGEDGGCLVWFELDHAD